MYYQNSTVWIEENVLSPSNGWQRQSVLSKKLEKNAPPILDVSYKNLIRETLILKFAKK